MLPLLLPKKNKPSRGNWELIGTSLWSLSRLTTRLSWRWRFIHFWIYLYLINLFYFLIVNITFLVKLQGNLVAPILPIWGIHEIRNSLIDFRWFQCLQLIQSGSKVMHVEVTGTTKVCFVKEIRLYIPPFFKTCRCFHEFFLNQGVSRTKRILQGFPRGQGMC